MYQGYVRGLQRLFEYQRREEGAPDVVRHYGGGADGRHRKRCSQLPASAYGTFVLRRWHQKHGLQQRRSCSPLRTGGSGKTSTIRALTSCFGRDACFPSMTEALFSNQAHDDALPGMLPCALMVIEDVSDLFTKEG